MAARLPTKFGAAFSVTSPRALIARLFAVMVPVLVWVMLPPDSNDKTPVLLPVTVVGAIAALTLILPAVMAPMRNVPAVTVLSSAAESSRGLLESPVAFAPRSIGVLAVTGCSQTTPLPASIEAGVLTVEILIRSPARLILPFALSRSVIPSAPLAWLMVSVETGVVKPILPPGLWLKLLVTESDPGPSI